MKKAMMKIAALIGMGLSLLALLIVLFVLVKGWSLQTPLKDSVSTLSDVAQKALLRLEGGADRLRTPVDNALVILDQVDATAREWGEMPEKGRPLSAQLLETAGDRFSREIETVVHLTSTIGQAVVVFNQTLETFNRFSSVKVPTLSDELTKISEQILEMKNRLQEFRDTVDGLKVGAVPSGVEGVLSRTQWFRAPLTRIRRNLEGLANLLADKRNKLMELEGNLLFYIDLGVLALSILGPVLIAGQAALGWASWRLFRRKGKGGVWKSHPLSND